MARFVHEIAGDQAARVATRLLEPLGPENDALLGDLADERRAGRSAVWYWRQVLTTIVIKSFDRIHAHMDRSLKALAISAFVYHVISVPTVELGNAVNWVLTPRGPSGSLRELFYFFGRTSFDRS